MLIILGLLTSFSLSFTAHAQNDLRSFNISGFSKPYGPEKKQEMQNLGWARVEKKDGKSNRVYENYSRRADGYDQQVVVEYNPPRQEALHVMPAETNTVLVGYAPAQEGKIAPYLPLNLLHLAQQIKERNQQQQMLPFDPIYTGLYDNQQQNFSYCEAPPPPPSGMVGHHGMFCQSANREICDYALAKKNNEMAMQRLERQHSIYARIQLQMMRKKQEINRTPTSDSSPSPQLLQACDNFYAAYGTGKRLPSSIDSIAPQTQKVPRENFKSGESRHAY